MACDLEWAAADCLANKLDAVNKVDEFRAWSEGACVCLCVCKCVLVIIDSLESSVLYLFM